MICFRSELLEFLRDQYVPETLITDETAKDYAGTLRLFDRFSGYAAIDEVDPNLIGRFLRDMLHQGRSVETARKHARVLRAVLKLARRKKLTAMSVRKIPHPKPKKKLPRAWSREQFERELEAAAGLEGCVGPWPTRYWLPALMLTVWSTGWRITANMRIETRNVDLESASVVSYESKTSEERFAVLTPEAVDALRRIWEPGRKYLFGDWPYDRNTRQWKALNRLLRKVIVQANVPDIGRWHVIRKTGATAIAIKEKKVLAAAQYCGHKQEVVTIDHYLDPTLMQEGESKLPRLRIVADRQQRWLF